MQTPTTAQIRTAIEVLKKLGEHLNTNAANTVINLPDSQHFDRHAASIEARTIEQTTLRASLRNWKAGGTNCCNRGGNVLLIMFKTGHALPLRAEGFCVREAVAVNPQNICAI